MVHAISSEFTLNLITLTLIRLVDYRNEQLRKVCVNSPRLFSRRVVSLKAYRSEKSGKYKNCSRWLIDLKLKLILVPNVCAIWLYHYSRVSLNIGDRRILRVLRIILRLNFDEVWLFYSDKSDEKKKSFPEMRNFSA